MDEMRRRANGTGSYDWRAKCWRAKTQGIHATVGTLQRMYGVTFAGRTPDQLERESAPYWRRYLQDIEDNHRQAQKAASPLQTRIRSLESMIARLRGEGRSDAILERLEGELREAVTVPPHDIDHADMPVYHPDIVARARAMQYCTSDDDVDDAMCIMLEATEPPRTTAPKGIAPKGIVHEANVYIDRHKSKGHKGWFDVRKAVGLLTDVTGDVPVEHVTVEHMRAVNAKIKGNPNWGDTTRANLNAIVRDFLRQIAADFNLTCYGFLSNKAYRLKRGKGKKIKYTLEQVQTALKHATGDVRLAVMVGLNTGAIIGDIASMTSDMIVDGRLVRSRAKLQHKDEPLVGSWLLWDETKKVMRYGVGRRRLQDQYTQFSKKLSLPTHKEVLKNDRNRSARRWICRGRQGCFAARG